MRGRLSISTRSSIIASKIRSTVASKACLRLHSVAFLFTLHSVTYEHTESLKAIVRIKRSINRSGTYRLKSLDLALARRDIIHNKATLGLPCVLITEEISIKES